MDFAFIMAEERIKQAIEQGELDDLPGKGKPLQLEDLSAIPEELRVGYKILKNAGMVPEEVQLNKQMMTIEELIACCEDEKEKENYQRQLTEKKLRYQMLMDRRKMKATGSFRSYRSKINQKLGL